MGGATIRSPSGCAVPRLRCSSFRICPVAVFGSGLLGECPWISPFVYPERYVGSQSLTSFSPRRLRRACWAIWPPTSPQRRYGQPYHPLMINNNPTGAGNRYSAFLFALLIKFCVCLCCATPGNNRLDTLLPMMFNNLVLCVATHKLTDKLSGS